MRTKLFLIISAICFVLLASCKDNQNKMALEILENAPGDSTLYGLTCECNDSIIQVLPNDLSDPLTLNITPAWKSHQIFGMPDVGDHIAVILSEDSVSAVMVINIDRLAGKWCYLVEPSLHKPAAMDEKQFEMMSREIEKKMTDSIKQLHFKPLEYGLEINANKSVTAFKQEPVSNGESGFSMIEYPQPKTYKEWDLFNGRLILTGFRKGAVPDTATFEIIRNDSLIIHLADGDLNLYRKKEAKEKVTQ